jgi:Tol biopolymer transport system component
MPSTLNRIVALLFAAFFLNSCDATEPAQSSQDIGNAIWRSNSGLLAFAEQRAGAPSGAFIYKLYEAGGDGKLGRLISEEETDEPVPFIATSGDGNTAITVLRSTLYKLDIPSGAKTQLTSNVTKVYAVSPDLKYVLLTHAGRLETVKTVSLLDISGPGVRSVKEWQLRGLLLSQGFWLSGDRIALNLDTVGRPFVSIFDTNGSLIKSFANAQTPARSSAYVPGSEILFVKSFESLEQLTIETGARINIADSYVNLDARGNTLAYIVNEGGKKRVYIRNISTGETQEVATDAFRFAVLSPDESKLAYLVESRQNYTELKVIPVTTP